MNTDIWADFTNKVDKNLDQTKIANLIIKNIQELNKQWYIFYNAIRKASTKHIPTTKIQPKIYYSFSIQATKLHQSLKRLNKILQVLKQNSVFNNNKNIQKINNDIEYINKNTEHTINLLTAEDLNTTNLNNTRTQFKQLQKTIHQARKIENNTAHNNNINQHINNRYNNFTNNTTKMINSILHRHTNSVAFHNIILPDEIITNL